MKDYLMREDAPLSEKQWNELDNVVVDVAKNKLIGRKVVHTYGPLGGGVQSIEIDKIDLKGEGQLSKFSGEEDERIEVSERRFIPIPLIYKDFMITWRDLENLSLLNRPFDYSLVAAATSALAKKEDNIIFNGTKESQGIMNAKGRLSIKYNDWNEGENPYKDVAKAIEQLIEADSYGPYAFVASTDLYMKMQRIQKEAGVTVLSRVKELVEGRVYQSPLIEDSKAVVMSLGPQNMDLVIGEDIVTAYMGDENLNHLFRVMESIALRIKRPESICTIE